MTHDNNNNQKNTMLEALKAELVIAEADQKGLSSRKRNLKRKIAELEAQVPGEDAAAEDAKKAAEAKAKAEAEAKAKAEEEAKAKKAAKDADDTPTQEDDVEDADVTPAQEDDAEDADDTPAQEDDADDADDTSAQEDDVDDADDSSKQDNSGEKKGFNWLHLAFAGGILLAIVLALIALCKQCSNNQGGVMLPNDTEGIVESMTAQVEDVVTSEPETIHQEDVVTTESETTQQEDVVTSESETTQQEDVATSESEVDSMEQVVPGDPTDTEETTETAEPEFDIQKFVISTQNIAKTLTDDDNIVANVNVFIDKVGEDKLVELVDKYDEFTVQKAIAEFLAFVPEIKMNQYISNNGLDYNPNAVDDYYLELLEADNAYRQATGKNPNGALMSLEGYDIHKSNREAMKALIIESGDADLLIWYEAKTEGYDVMEQQKADTEKALAYKEEVKLELVNKIAGSVKLLELQLEKKVNGTDNNTLEYTDVYEKFIINNYMYVVATT